MIQLNALPIKKVHILGPLIVIIITLFALIFDKNISGTLIYNHALVDDGEYWRLISSHFFHTNTNHFLLNVTAVFLLWALHGHYYNYKNYLLVFIISAIFCGLGIFWFSLDIKLYVGLSGVLHGFFVWGALLDIKHQEKTGYILLIGIVIKITHEQLYGASTSVALFIESNVAIDAHMFGAIGGLFSFLLCYFDVFNKK